MRTVRIMTVDGIEESSVDFDSDAEAWAEFDRVLAEANRGEAGEGFVAQVIEGDDVLAEVSW